MNSTANYDVSLYQFLSSDIFTQLKFYLKHDKRLVKFLLSEVNLKEHTLSLLNPVSIDRQDLITQQS